MTQALGITEGLAKFWIATTRVALGKQSDRLPPLITHKIYLPRTLVVNITLIYLQVRLVSVCSFDNFACRTIAGVRVA